ncbi:hypothetical protein BFW01_g410 [Lasiodiplodia theobromae]|uniref:Uncharacterized protein n=1 Tax=Lasiodiplodia theobromae TaxID=45133 RepID=A0A8H7IRC5_9PEZI|nr:hypothetical protein BFW01_g410 [Lasiodiplodia theobromae]
MLINQAVLVWTDAGRDLGEGPKGPWLDSHNEQVTSATSPFCPTFQHLPELHRRSSSIPTTTENHLKGPFPQSAALLPCNYGRFLDKSLMAKDAFYAVHDIFGFCASAICQFLNMIESVIEEETGFAAMSNTQYSLSTLLYHQDVLEKQTRDLRSSIEKIRARGGSSWPHAQEGDGKEDAEAAAQSLMRDYEELLFRAHTLSKRCKSGIAVLMSQASIEESKKAISQTEKMKALTLLGFFYLPLSFTTSFFGMNLGAVGTGGKMGIWVWFVVSIPVLLISFGFLKLMTFRLR